MSIRATKSGMRGYTSEELLAYVERTEEKYQKAPAFLKRTSFARWKSDSIAIGDEIQIRLLDQIGKDYA